ncbi:HAMP domain-containing histidine kinase [Paenarthrobacter sp. Z7-10]|uniref:sensor histidine kinase n=1 Tax=Paenarthrobacter sp. Z7-10 TaxID=2787635 RepID=UPI0022A9E7BA|nr:HAMP domain-containing sensor histidine kinase [Paenarthrobacter sp. Z7-10]MCZ2403589.1 HAMP domain-containing histidine kinase [Paenarthrobacter sp. Z7-10]
MSEEDLLTILRVVLFWAVSIGVITVLLQRLLRRASIVIQLCLVVVATIGVLMAGMISAFNAMFISAHDLEVMWYILAIASLVAVAVAVVLGLRVARNTRILIGAARRIGRGETVLPQGKMSSELAALAAELQSTSEKLDESRRREAVVEQARRELVSWVSHDLRTPLASMRAMTEALEDGVVTDVSGYHRKIIGQADQMAVLINDLLELSKIQAGTIELRIERLDLYDLVSDAIADLAPLAERRSISINGERVRPTLAAADAASLGRAVRNVILNAIIYSREGSTVRIAASGGAGWATVVVEDECGGIAEDDLSRLFTTGWQKAPGRRKSPFSGAGIGLSMVAGIVKAHQGTVEAANAGQGCRFTLRLPVPAMASKAAGQQVSQQSATQQSATPQSATPHISAARAAALSRPSAQRAAVSQGDQS